MGHRANNHLGATVHDKGVDFSVWAPFAKNVALLQWLEFEWSEVPMESHDDGIWAVENVAAEPGQMYKYRITAQDGTVFDRNDPYARQLTDSDNGSSVIVDAAFEWEGADAFVETPKQESVIYELHIGTFHRPDASTTGTFQTAIEKLAYLKELGITHVELMPVTSMAMSHGWGYAPNHIFSIEASYGGRHGLLEFIKACHQLDIGVIIDVVYNHFHLDTDLWQFDGWSENNRGGIYFFNDERGDTPWGGRPDYGREEVRQFILDNVAMWFSEYHVDGLRVDSTIYMRNSDGNNDKHELDIPEAWSLMREVNQLAHKINPHALMIAEDNSTNPGIIQGDGMGFDAQWEVGFPHVIRDGLGITSLESQPALEGVEWALTHSYDTAGFDRVIFGDSHDTAANGSSRLNEAVTPGNAESLPARQRVLLSGAITLTAPGIPMLLQGQEFMQEGAFNEWQMLEWEKTEQFAGIVAAHKHLIDLRRNLHQNTRGLLGQHTAVLHRDDTNSIIAYHRFDKGGALDDTVVVANFGADQFDEYELTFPHEGTWTVRFNSSWKGYNPDFNEAHVTFVEADKNRKATLPLPAYGSLILSIDR